NKAKYGNVISTINEYYAATNERARSNNYLVGLLRTSNFSVAPYRIGGALTQYANENEAKRKEMRPQIEELINSVFETAYLPLEEDMLASQLNLYYTKAQKGGIAPYVKQIGDNNGGDFKDYANKAFSNSIFVQKNELIKFLDNPVADVIQNDELYKLSTDILNQYRAETPEQKQLHDAFTKSFRLLVDGLRKSGLNSIQYPDANSTLRLTYGTVVDLPLGKGKVNDAKENYYTTLKGTIAKHKPGDDEFENPQKLIDLYNKKDYGQYADKAGYLPVNFLTNHDITGGNSGSPVLNGNGELIGIAFDGNIEAMAGDVIFDPELQRTISVDIRYVLFIIDKFAGAKNIIDELTIVK
ncbi:MAG TPA: S46 family peptidase, partial [Moheibacter sp.]|nr:S46 family peptidase [Moheibacter sp.]